MRCRLSMIRSHLHTQKLGHKVGSRHGSKIKLDFPGFAFFPTICFDWSPFLIQFSWSSSDSKMGPTTLVQDPSSFAVTGGVPSNSQIVTTACRD